MKVLQDLDSFLDSGIGVLTRLVKKKLKKSKDSEIKVKTQL